jgi:hypothetical protein
MNVIITSTLFPSVKNLYFVENDINHINSEERFQQTVATILSIKKYNINAIYLLDNSLQSIPDLFKSKIEKLGVTLVCINSTIKSRNKGFLEIEMIEKFLEFRCIEGPIMKISARYTIGVDSLLFRKSSKPLVGKVYHIRRGFSEFSTRAYIVNNSITYRKLLKEAKFQVKLASFRFGTPFLINRFIKFLKKMAIYFSFEIALDPKISIEEGFYRASRKIPLEIETIEELKISGIIGSNLSHFQE